MQQFRATRRLKHNHCHIHQVLSPVASTAAANAEAVPWQRLALEGSDVL
jgi:hypothetical protein